MTALTVLEFEQQQVRTVVIDAEPWFVLADVCAVLGIGNSRAVAARLEDDERNTVTLTDGNRGNPNVTVVSEAGLFDVVIRSDSPRARPFRRWVTHEVLPQIRRTGSYAAAHPLPQTFSEALRELAASVERTEQLEAAAREAAPKVLFADSVATSETTILVGELAKILRGNGMKIGGTRLFALLREEGYLIRREGSDWNMPTQKSMELGLFRIKETAITHSDGSITVSKTVKVTGKGQAYFIRRYLSGEDDAVMAS